MNTMVAQAGTSRALVSFYLAETETLIFWLDSNSPETKVARAAVGRVEIQAAAAALRKFFSKERINFERPEYTTDMAWLNTLGSKLLEPLRSWLATCDGLVIAPHGELHALPIHLLALEGGSPLAVTHSISYVANLSLYALLLARNAGGRENFSVSSLCMATAAREDPEAVNESFAMTPRSFAVKTGGIFLQGVEATWAAFREYAESTGSIYLSCHGCFNEQDSLKSTLLLSDGVSLPSKTEPTSLLHGLSVQDILELRVRSRLVILDACMSGVEHFSPGDEPMGFSTAFLLSGADAVIASNWSVEQNRARFFMEELQRSWSSGTCTLGQAMKQAYTATRTNYPHPYHWGAFSLIGNDRLPFS
ncbi:MAG TPA: CHAT domain-containing protein [Pyrinomonadaceae bacterium]|nr:CHAT domain-containing protein [Pyrinomonadaceae bacterium]